MFSSFRLNNRFHSKCVMVMQITYTNPRVQHFFEGFDLLAQNHANGIPDDLKVMSTVDELIFNHMTITITLVSFRR